MDVQKIATAIGLTNVKVIRKAEEYMRLCKIRCPGGIGGVCLCCLLVLIWVVVLEKGLSLC